MPVDVRADDVFFRIRKFNFETIPERFVVLLLLHHEAVDAKLSTTTNLYFLYQKARSIYKYIEDFTIMSNGLAFWSIRIN